MAFTWYYLSLTAGILLLISGFLDIIDGSVARASHRTSKRGAFMDSILDKFAETIVYGGIAFSGLVNPILCMAALSSSLLVSYTRSRAESLGVDLKGIGLAERAERLLIISLAAIVPVMNAMSYALALVLILSIITLYQRLRHTYNKLNYN
jgi:archaetidylinositol phosphate synthase